MTELNLMTPEAEELLREIAADPKSSLMRIPRRGRGRASKLVELSGRSFGKAPGRSRSPAERRLAEVQRSEVARVLRETCSSRFVSDPATKLTVNNHTRDQVPGPPLLDSTPTGKIAYYDEDIEEAIYLLHLNSNARSATDRPPIGQLATIAHKLCPTPTSQLHIAFDLLYKGHRQTARQLLRRIAVNEKVRVKASALECSALCWAFDKNPMMAYREFLHAYKLGSPRPSSILSAFGNAIDMGDLSLAKFSGRLVDEAFGLEHPAIRHFIQSHAKRKLAGTFKTTELGRRVSRHSHRGFGPIASEFMRVYAE